MDVQSDSSLGAELIQAVVEAALLASSQPLTLPQLQELFPLDQALPEGAVEAALAALHAACDGRGVELVEVASGYRYQVRREVHPWVARLWAERAQRYTRATLETLALIAYRQPITRGEIEQIRGVAVSTNIIKTLEEREWIRVIGHRDVPGRPALFGTTRLFLDYFNLKSLDELPPLSELRDLSELEPQLPFEVESAAAVAAPDPEDALPVSLEDATDVVIPPFVAHLADAASDSNPSISTSFDTKAADDDADTAPEHIA
ncbi:MAG: SMC-Scp complex subunit ScpB [Xanthomonadales bacterium]|nr:SMC-Scp complex subunit ScpB [Xanthomonadales bacterium]